MSFATKKGFRAGNKLRLAVLIKECSWMSHHQHAQQERTAGIDGLHGYALVCTRNRTDAEDLVQDDAEAAGRTKKERSLQ